MWGIPIFSTKYFIVMMIKWKIAAGNSRTRNEFTDDINLLGGSEEELQQLAERPEKTAVGYSIEICPNKSKIPVNSIKPRPSSANI